MTSISLQFSTKWSVVRQGLLSFNASGSAVDTSSGGQIERAKNYTKVHNVNFFSPSQCRPKNICLAFSFAQFCNGAKYIRVLQVFHREVGLSSAQSYKSLRKTTHPSLLTVLLEQKRPIWDWGWNGMPKTQVKLHVWPSCNGKQITPF
jgi:hypothetical protein